MPSPNRVKGPICSCWIPDASAALIKLPILRLFPAKSFAFFIKAFFFSAASQAFLTWTITSLKSLCRALVSLSILTIKYPPSSLSNNWLCSPTGVSKTLDKNCFCAVIPPIIIPSSLFPLLSIDFNLDERKLISLAACSIDAPPARLSSKTFVRSNILSRAFSFESSSLSFCLTALNGVMTLGVSLKGKKTFHPNEVLITELICPTGVSNAAFLSFRSIRSDSVTSFISITLAVSPISEMRLVTSVVERAEVIELINF